jgi:hypothetical protein
MLRKILCYLLLVLTISTVSESSELKLEFDKNQSTITGVSNMSTIYFGLSSLQDDCDGIRFKIFNSSALSFLSSYLGHEYYGHSYILRKYNIDHDFRLFNLRTDHSPINDPDTELNMSIYGLKFNGEIEKVARKDQVMNNINYKNSLFLICQKGIPLCTFKDKGKYSDYTHYSKSNPINDFKKHVNISIYDPTLWYSVLCVFHSFIYNEEIEYQLPSLSVNFEIYPHETSNLFTIAKKIDDHYINFSYEKGSKHDGCGFEITNLRFTNSISLDYKFHYFDGYRNSMTLYYKHFYTRLNISHLDYDDISDNIQIGWKF